MERDFAVVTTTFDDSAVGERIMNALFERRLAACVQTMPIMSHYRWHGKLCHEPETLMIIKTRMELFPVIAELIRSEHSYEVPEIVVMPVVDGLPDYLAWISAETAPELE